MGKVFIIAGIVLLAAGILIELSDKIPIQGRLPGDIVIEKKHVKFHLPLATSLLVSLLLTLLFMLIRWFRN